MDTASQEMQRRLVQGSGRGTGGRARGCRRGGGQVRVLEAVQAQVDMGPGITGVARGDQEGPGDRSGVQACDDAQADTRSGREEPEIVAVGQRGMVVRGGQTEGQAVAVGEQAVARGLADRPDEGHIEEQQRVPAGRQGT